MSASTHTYTSEYPPNTPFDPAYKQFFEQFYALSDTPAAHAEYAGMFAAGARVVMGAREAVVGYDAILILRKSLWEKVSSRHHTAVKVFPFGANSNEAMLYGTVTYGLKAGGESALDWAARAQLGRDEEGRVRLEFYQVYLDTGAQAK